MSDDKENKPEVIEIKAVYGDPNSGEASSCESTVEAMARSCLRDMCEAVDDLYFDSNRKGTTMTNPTPLILRDHEIKHALTHGCGQFRRVVRPQPTPEPQRIEKGMNDEWVPTSNSGKIGIFNPSSFKCPFGTPGDRVWVKETWTQRINGEGHPVIYRANNSSDTSAPKWCLWRISPHMPRWVSRLTLEITAVRVERVQEVSGKDACLEGWPGKILTCCGDGCHWDGTNEKDIVQATDSECDEAVDWFADIFNSHAKPGEDFASNPFVWVGEYKVVDTQQTQGEME